ncbi:hypothetical protein L7F22_068268 [Adiantum nelumboides]|nr:hypothetical protein [Adiantum nelumboides]
MIASSNQCPMNEEGEPRLFVHIPIQWPSARGSVSSTEIEKQNKLQNLFFDGSTDETYPSSSTRPRMTYRSHSNRQLSATKTIAAAVSTQKENRKRRSRVTSTDSSSSSFSSSSSSSSTTSEDEQKLNRMSESQQQQQQQQQQQKFATLPRSETIAIRKIMERRRHARSTSVPDAPAKSLHVDTFLPLHLPPPELCAKSPLLAYPCSWWSTEEDEKEVRVHATPIKAFKKESTILSTQSSFFGLPTANADLRRSESLASFVSAQSDGSWHGDQGDNDPDGQLARALGESKRSDDVKDQMEAHENEEVSNNYQETSNAKDSSLHGHGPLQLSTYDYDEEDDHHKVPHAQVSSTSKKAEAKADEEQDIAKSAGPLMERLAKYMFNLSIFGSDQNDESSPLETGMSHSQSDGHLFGQLSSPSSLNAETKAKQIGRSSILANRDRAATIAGDLDLLAHGEIGQEDLENASSLWSLWRWIIPDIDSYMSEGTIDNDTNSLTMKRNMSVPSLVSGYSLDTVNEDEWEEEEQDVNNKIESTLMFTNDANNGSLLSQSPPQLCYAESYLRDSGFGLKSFESSAFNEFNLSGEVPAKVLSTRNHLPTSFLIRTSKDILGKQNTKITKQSSSSDPSPLWDNRLVEEPYERTWGSMLGLSVY